MINNKYNVSVIVPVYNASNYLDDCIKSIINQTYGFKKIELVLVNDGSIDNSLEICKKYASKYNNIKIIDKENSGVSDTRNTGFKESTGKYIMFLDSDDLINKHSIKCLTHLLDKNSDYGFAISRVRMFEKTNNWHYMDYRFKDGKNYVDIDKDITYSQYHSTGILLRRSIIEDIKFDGNIKYGEDMKFMTQVLLKSNLFGKDKKSILYYRKRNTDDSAVQRQQNDRSYYITTLDKSFNFIFDEVQKKYGCITKYFQYYILNSLVERFDIEYNDVLNEKDFKKYISMFKSFISKMDDDVIMMQRRVGLNVKYYLLKLKHGDKYKIDVEYKNQKVYFNDKKYDFKVSEFVKILKIENNENKLRFYISMNDYLFNDKINTYVNGNKINMKKSSNKELKQFKYRDIEFKTYYEDKVYMFDIDLDNDKVIQFKIDNKSIPYSLYKDFSFFNYNKRYLRVKNKLIYFSKYNIVIDNKLAILKSSIYKGINILSLIRRSDYYTISVNNGKPKKVLKKI